MACVLKEAGTGLHFAGARFYIFFGGVGVHIFTFLYCVCFFLFVWGFWGGVSMFPIMCPMLFLTYIRVILDCSIEFPSRFF